MADPQRILVVGPNPLVQNFEKHRAQRHLRSDEHQHAHWHQARGAKANCVIFDRYCSAIHKVARGVDCQSRGMLESSGGPKTMAKMLCKRQDGICKVQACSSSSTVSLKVQCRQTSRLTSGTCQWKRCEALIQKAPNLYTTYLTVRTPVVPPVQLVWKAAELTAEARQKEQPV